MASTCLRCEKPYNKSCYDAEPHFATVCCPDCNKMVVLWTQAPKCDIKATTAIIRGRVPSDYERHAELMACLRAVDEKSCWVRRDRMVCVWFQLRMVVQSLLPDRCTDEPEPKWAKAVHDDLWPEPPRALKFNS
jgi:hypothetical protein